MRISPIDEETLRRIIRDNRDNRKQLLWIIFSELGEPPRKPAATQRPNWLFRWLFARLEGAARRLVGSR